MALPITGGGPSFPNTILDVVADDDTILIAAFPFEDIEIAAIPAMIAMEGDTGVHPSLIIEKGHFIFTAPPDDTDPPEVLAASMLASLNFALVG